MTSKYTSKRSPHAALPGVAVIGCGYWGPNVARNLNTLEGCELRAICDIAEARVEKLHGVFPMTRACSDAQSVFESDDIAGVVICTPVHTHYDLARRALEAGKHVLVEKPLTSSVPHARELVALARDRGLVLQVDHTFVYSPALALIQRMIDNDELGRLLYVDSVRINLGLFQPDVSVLWDLAVHDLSIVTHLVDRPPLWVSAVGSSPYGDVENLAYLTVMFPDDLIAHVNVNWLSPVKLRSTVIGGSKRMIVYDDLAPSEKIRVYDKGVDLNGDPQDPRARRERALVDYRLGSMTAPYIEKVEPLACVCRDFLAAMTTGRPPAADGEAGLAVVRLLAAAEESIRKRGERIPLESA